MSASSRGSSDRTCGCRLRVDRGWPRTRQARRSDTLSCPLRFGRGTRLFGASPGSEVSRGRLSKDCVVERYVGNELLQAGVLLLELLQALGLVELETAVLLPPALVGLLGDSDLLASLGNALALREHELSFAELGDDFFRTVTFSSHVFHLLIFGE